MARSARARPESRRIALGEDLRIAQAREAFAAIAAAADARSVEIDAGRVARVDGAGLQALAAGVGRLRAAGVECRWSAVSEALAGAAGLAGLAAALALT